MARSNRRGRKGRTLHDVRVTVWEYRAELASLTGPDADVEHYRAIADADTRRVRE